MMKNPLIFRLSKVLGIISIVLVVCIFIIKAVPYPVLTFDAQFVQKLSTEGIVAEAYDTNVSPEEFDAYLIKLSEESSIDRLFAKVGLARSSASYVRNGTTNEFREYRLRSGFNLFGINEILVTFVPTYALEGYKYLVTVVEQPNSLGGLSFLLILIITANLIVYKKLYKRIKTVPYNLFFVFFYIVTFGMTYGAALVWPAFSFLPNADTSHIAGVFDLALYLNGGTYLYMRNIFLESFVWSVVFMVLSSLIFSKKSVKK